MMHTDPILDRGLPANPEAERMILGSILIDQARFPLVAETLADESEWSLQKHRLIWSAMKAMWDRAVQIDRVTLANELQRNKQLEAVDGITYLVSLDDGLPTICNLESYIGIVAEKATLRKAIIAAQALINDCTSSSDSADGILSRAGRVLATLSDSRAPRGELKSTAEVVQDYPGGVNAFLSPHLKERGIATPFGGLNRLITGLGPGQLIIIGARPAVGKTAMAVRMAHVAAMNGHGAAVFSLEMAASDLIHRIVCADASVDSQAFRDGRCTPDERRRLMRAATEVTELPLWMSDHSSTTVPSLHAAMRKLMNRQKVELGVVDYLQLMRCVNGRENKNQEITEISRDLKLMARELGIPMVVLSQLSRSSATDNREPNLTDLRDSGSIEQDADIVMFLHPRLAEETTECLPVDLILAKQRRGPRGRVKLMFLKRYVRFEEDAGAFAEDVA